MMEPDEFRRILGHFPSGVTVVTTRDAGGEPLGLTVNAFCSVSLRPPLVLMCIDRVAEDVHGALERERHFGVNVLGEEDGEALSRRFANPELRGDFSALGYREGPGGAPLLEGALAWLECGVWRSVPAGDHTIFIGEVTGGDAGAGGPLLYYRGGYGRFQS